MKILNRTDPFMSKADRVISGMTNLDGANKKWIFGNDTDDALRFAFDVKRVVHPGVMGTPVHQKEIGALWEGLMRKNALKAKRAAYIHIPFCQTRCIYCGFFQNFSDKEMEDAYINALIEDLRMTGQHQFIKSYPFNAVYFGGGTPSALSPQNIERLLKEVHKSLPLANDCEITFESRFYDFTDEKIQKCLEGGVNRFSLGVQSFNKKVRRSIGRIYDRDAVLERLKYLMSLNHAAIVIDLMYGLPYQAMEVWESDVNTLIESGIDGGDLYQLNVFEDSKLKKVVSMGGLPPAATTSEQAEMFKRCVEIMKEKRWKRLSICHWGRNSRERNMYNSLSKSGAVTIPFGSGAGGRIDGFTFFLERDIKAYIERIKKGEPPLMFLMSPPKNHRLYSDIIGQMDKGRLDLYHIKTTYGVDLEDITEPVFNEWKRKRLIEVNGGFLDLTLSGQFWYVNIIQAILDWLVMMKDENYTPVIKAIAVQG